MDEEKKQLVLQEIENKQEEVIYAYPQIPYFLLEKDFDENICNSFKKEFELIMKYYEIYHLGADFATEGSNGDYVPSQLRYKKSRLILNKEARFFVANPPSFNVNVDDVTGKYAKENAIIQDYLDKVLEKTNFHGKLMKGVKDCFIGKRIAITVNFNEEDGISITFFKSTEFVYSLGKDEKLDKFTAYYETTGVDTLSEQRWFRKHYEKTKDGIFLTEEIYDGAGEIIEQVTKKTKIKLTYIPAVVIFNDGLTGDIRGESELLDLMFCESYYSKLANSDMDSERKNMHPIRYTVDAAPNSTDNLSSAAGSYWDIQTDGDKAQDTSFSAKVGIVEAQMNYSNPLKITLDRLENEMYSSLDVPNITSEQLAGVITSGKTIQALYWGLTVRCDEKMLSWEGALRTIAYAIIDGGKLYPKCIKQYTSEKIPDIPYDVLVENNYPIPEDVKEEKEMDITEVDAKIMSRKAYLKKWRKLNDEEAASELEQIKLESEMLDNTYLNYSTSDTVSTSDADNDVEDVNNGNENQNNKQYNKVSVGQSANARNALE